MIGWPFEPRYPQTEAGPITFAASGYGTKNIRLTLVVCLALALVPAPGRGQDDLPPPPEPEGTWWWSGHGGLTDLVVDEDAPAHVWLMAVERRALEGRLSLSAEAGFGSIDRTGPCTVGGLDSQCRKATVWPSLGMALHVRVPDSGTLSDRTYLVAQVGAQGPDLDHSRDLGAGLSWFTRRGTVGFEIRRRYGTQGGMIYLFRVSGAFGSPEADPEPD